METFFEFVLLISFAIIMCVLLPILVQIAVEEYTDHKE